MNLTSNIRTIDTPWDVDTHYFLNTNWNKKYDIIFNGNKGVLFVRNDDSHETPFQFSEWIVDYFDNGYLEVVYGHKDLKLWFKNGKLHRVDKPAFVMSNNYHFIYRSLYYLNSGKVYKRYYDDEGTRFGCYIFDEYQISSKKEFEEHWSNV